jgi:putative membrane protein
MRLILNWLVSAAAIMIAAYLLPGVDVSGWVVALILAVVLGAINAFVKPLMVLLTLPVTMLTLGLFLFVIDALLIMLAAAIVPGFMVASFWWALIFSVVLTLVSAVFYMMGADPVHD